MKGAGGGGGGVDAGNMGDAQGWRHADAPAEATKCGVHQLAGVFIGADGGCSGGADPV